MGKKKKKPNQQRKQAKILKRKAQQKQQKKQSNLLKSKKKIPGMPGVPGGIPPHMRQAAEHMATFAMPIFELAKPTSPGQFNSLAALIQGWWSAFETEASEKRQQMLDELKKVYATLSWATVPFEELSELLLKRHIALVPLKHSEAERNRYTEAELQAAMAFSYAEAEEEGTVETDEAASAEVEESAEAPEEEAETVAERVSEALPLTEPLTAELAKTVAGDNLQPLIETGKALLENHDKIDFINTNDPNLQKLQAFQDDLLDVFTQTLMAAGLPKSLQKVVSGSMSPFYREFLPEYHQTGILATTPDQLEEYLLDYYLRKVRRTSESDRYLLDAFKHFWLFLAELKLTDDADNFVVRIKEIQQEFDEEAQQL